MLAFVTQHPALRSGDARGNRALCVHRAAWVGFTCASLGIADAAGFDENAAFTTMRTHSTASVIVNESCLKDLSVASINGAMGIKAAVWFDDTDSSPCNERKQPLCRDLATSEFQVVSLRFMLPDVRGLSAKSLNIRRNSVSATYTFR
jgi:hypothetical protein